MSKKRDFNTVGYSRKIKGMNAKIQTSKGCTPNAKPKRIRHKKIEETSKETLHIKINLGNFLIALIIGLFAPISIGIKILLITALILCAFSEGE